MRSHQVASSGGVAVASLFLCPIPGLLPHSMLTSAWCEKGASSRGPPASLQSACDCGTPLFPSSSHFLPMLIFFTFTFTFFPAPTPATATSSCAPKAWHGKGASSRGHPPYPHYCFCLNHGNPPPPPTHTTTLPQLSIATRCWASWEPAIILGLS